MARFKHPLKHVEVAAPCKADWDHDSICTVAGLSFGRLPPLKGIPCCVGDVFRMIPPLTGNGMSIAFESAELASTALVDYAQGRISWNEARAGIARGYVKAFRDRFFWADLLQEAAFSSFARPLSMCFASQRMFRLCFEKTR